MNNYTGYIYNYFSDAGHGWLEVREDELTALGIADKISDYSYTHPTQHWVYLEEDRDLSIFLKAKEDAGTKVERSQIKAVSHGNYSRIRRYDRYTRR